jgi:hypothetical protein
MKKERNISECFCWLNEHQMFLTSGQAELVKNIKRYYLLYHKVTNNQKRLLNEIIKYLTIDENEASKMRPFFILNT